MNNGDQKVLDKAALKKIATTANGKMDIKEKRMAERDALVARRDKLVQTIVSQLADKVGKPESAESQFSLLDPKRIDSLAKSIKILGEFSGSRARELAEWALCHSLVNSTLSLPMIDSKDVTFREDDGLAPVIKGFEFEGKQFKLDEEKLGEGAGAEVRFFKHGDEILVLKAMKPHEGTTQYGRNAELVNETWMQSVASGDPADPKVVRPRGMLRLSNGDLVMIMDCARNGSVQDLYDPAKTAAPPTLAESMKLGRGCLEAVVTVHEKGVGHGDISWANFFMNGTPF